MQKIKICHLTTVHPVFDHRILYKECKTLVKAGYEVYLVVTHDIDETIDGVNIVALPKSQSRFERMFKKTRLAYKRALEIDAHVYHFHDPELIPVGLILKLKGKKVIYDVHEDYKSKIKSKKYIPKFLRFIISELFDRFEKFVSKFFDFIVTADNYVKERFKTTNVERIANFPKLINIERNIQKKSKEIKKCIYSGGITLDRGVNEIIKAFNYLEDLPIECIFIGSANDDIKNKFFSLKNQKIKYLGKKNWIQVFDYYLDADIGLNILHPIPAYIYSAENSVKLFEYMLCSLPIVTSNFLGLKNIIEKCNCGICVDPLNPKEIAEAIRYLVNNPDIARKMGENGRKAVLEKYNWENEAKKLLKVYESILQL